MAKSNGEETKLLPQVPELEEAVIGALLLDSSAYSIIEHIISAKMFYIYTHQLIFSAIEYMDKKKKPIDILTVTEQLRRHGKLDEVGGAYEVARLRSLVAGTGHIEFHAHAIQEAYIRREAINLGYRLANKAFDKSDDIADTIDQVGKELGSVFSIGVDASEDLSMLDLTQQAYDDMKRRISLFKEGKLPGIPTGVSELDRLTQGFKSGELIVVAGRPGSGKTAVAVHFAKIAAMSGYTPIFFSLEMKGVSLYNRMVLSECDADPERFKSGSMWDEDFTEINKGMDRIGNLPLLINERPNQSVAQMKTTCRRLRKKGKLSMVVIDYLQLVGSGKRGNKDGREREVAEISRDLKLLAKEFDVPVILLAQLSRQCESRPDKKPLLSDLRESGAIEQDADVVMMVYRPEYYGLTDPSGTPITGEGKLLVQKNRDGRVGEVKFRYNESLTKIMDY